MMKVLNLKIFIPNVLLCFVFLCFLSLTEQVFAGFYIHVSGAVQSYKNDMYQVKTKRGLIRIQASKLDSSLNKEINRRIGRRIQMGIPSHAIISFEKTRERHSRQPASKISSDFKKTRDSK